MEINNIISFENHQNGQINIQLLDLDVIDGGCNVT